MTSPCIHSIRYVFTARATHWRDPATYRWGAPSAARNVFPSLAAAGEKRDCGIEDPTVWRDERTGVLHALVHNWAAGGHAASANNGTTWRWFGGACSESRPFEVDWTRSTWPENVTFSDGTVVLAAQRERPHVVLAADGYTVVALSNGFRQANADGEFGDRTRTLVQATVL